MEFDPSITDIVRLLERLPNPRITITVSARDWEATRTIDAVLTERALLDKVCGFEDEAE